MYTRLSIENRDVADWNALYDFTEFELNEIMLLANKGGPNNMDHKK